MTTSVPPEPPGVVPVVRGSTGDVVIGRLPAAPAGVVTLPVPGGTLYVDPSAVDALPALVVVDEGRAATAIDRVFGEGVAAGASTAGEQPRLLPAARTEGCERLIRYAALRWLTSTGPLPVDRATLALECAVAADDAEDLLDPEVHEAPDVVEFAPLAVALARTLRTGGDGLAWPGLPDLLEDSLAAICRRVPLDDPISAVAHHEAELRRAMHRFGTGALDWDAWQQAVGSARPEAAVHAGVGGVADEAVVRSGRSSVDWAHVPPGVLDAAEGTVLWWVAPSGADRVRIEVEVLAHRAPVRTSALARLVGGDPSAREVLVTLSRREQTRGLRVRVYVPGFPLPVADAELRPSSDGQLWRGSVDVPARALGDDGILVDVHGTGWLAPPRFGPAAVPAEAMRWAGRGLALLRLSRAAPGTPRDGVREPWERARQLYATVAEGGGPGAALAARQEVRCLAVIVAHLEANGETRTRRLRAELDDRASTVTPIDVAVPDLTDPAWAPTVAELGLLGTRSSS